MKHTFNLLMACSLAAALSACGGGGGSNDPSPSPVPSSVASSAAVSSVVATSSSSVALSASSRSSVVSSAASSIVSSNASSVLSVASSNSSANSSVAASKVSTLISGSVYLKDGSNDDVDLDSPDSVNITLSLLDSTGKVIAASSPKLIKSITSDSHLGTPFTAELSGADAKTIVVLVSKSGFSDYARRLDFSAGVNLTATLTQLQQITLNTTQVTSISGKALDGYNVSVKNSNGTQEIVNGKPSGIADLSVSIPQSALPSGTSSVDVKMQAFNPNNPDEAQSFPGAYQDSTGNKLLSVAFNYTDLQTNAGVSLKKIAQKTRDSRLQAQKQSGTTITPQQFAKQASQKSGVAVEPVIINRKVPDESCLSLSQLGDANITQSGFQVPVYTYNPANGLWDLLGYGTLFDESGTLVPDNQTTFNCSIHTYVLEIEATNEIFLSNWWNLDYPLVFTKPVTLCANIELHDEGNKPVSSAILFVRDDDETRSISAETFVTDENGRVHIEVLSLDKVPDLSAKAQVFHASLFSEYKEAPITLSESCSMDTPPVVVQVAIPELCDAKGRVVDVSGTPLANRYVFAGDFTGSNPTLFPAFALTDATGNYDLSLECKQNYDVIEYFSAIFNGTGQFATDFVTNVNNTVGASEVSDNGKTAVLKDLVVTATKPIVYVTNAENSQTQITLSALYVGNDFPLTYSFSLKDLDKKVISSFSGTLKSSDFIQNVSDYPFPYVQLNFDHKLPTSTEPVFYQVDGEVTDSKGVKSPIIGSVFTGEGSSQ